MNSIHLQPLYTILKYTNQNIPYVNNIPNVYDEIVV